MALIPSGAPRDPGKQDSFVPCPPILTSYISYQHRPVQACVSLSIPPRLQPPVVSRKGEAVVPLTLHRRPGYGPVLSYLQAAQLDSPLRIHPLLNLRTWDPKPYGKYLAWNCIEVRLRIVTLRLADRPAQHPMFAAIWIDYDGTIGLCRSFVKS
jgi:hypothetical protein